MLLTLMKRFPQYEKRAAANARARRLEDKVALITGGSSAQGQADPRLFALEVAAVVLANFDLAPGLDLAAGRAVADEIVRPGGQAMALSLDVRRAAGWARVGREIVVDTGYASFALSRLRRTLESDFALQVTRPPRSHGSGKAPPEER